MDMSRMTDAEIAAAAEELRDGYDVVQWALDDVPGWSSPDSIHYRAVENAVAGYGTDYVINLDEGDTIEDISWTIYPVVGENIVAGGTGADELRDVALSLHNTPRLVPESEWTELIMGRAWRDGSVNLYRVVWTPENFEDMNGNIHTLWEDIDEIPVTWRDDSIVPKSDRAWFTPAFSTQQVVEVDDEEELFPGRFLAEAIENPWDYSIGNVLWYEDREPDEMPTDPDDLEDDDEDDEEDDE